MAASVGDNTSTATNGDVQFGIALLVHPLGAFAAPPQPESSSPKGRGPTP
eukprot:gene17915-biopygen3896